MTDVNVSVLLVEAAVQTIESLMNLAPEDAVEPDHQAVLEELRDTLMPPAEAALEGAEIGLNSEDSDAS